MIFNVWGVNSSLQQKTQSFDFFMKCIEVNKKQLRSGTKFSWKTPRINPELVPGADEKLVYASQNNSAVANFETAAGKCSWDSAPSSGDKGEGLKLIMNCYDNFGNREMNQNM